MCSQQWRVYGQYASLLHLFLHWPDNTSRNHPTVFKYPSSSILILVNTPLSLQLEAPLSLMMTGFRRRSKRTQENFHLQLDWDSVSSFITGWHISTFGKSKRNQEKYYNILLLEIFGGSELATEPTGQDRSARSILAAIWQVGEGDHTGRAAAAGLAIPRPSRREIRASPMGRPIFVSKSVRLGRPADMKIADIRLHRGMYPAVSRPKKVTKNTLCWSSAARSSPPISLLVARARPP
jgi:hypothetical protein